MVRWRSLSSFLGGWQFGRSGLSLPALVMWLTRSKRSPAMTSRPKPQKTAPPQEVYDSLHLLWKDAQRYRDGGQLAQTYRHSLLRIGTKLLPRNRS
jgi:hypothetical protein